MHEAKRNFEFSTRLPDGRETLSVCPSSALYNKQTNPIDNIYYGKLCSIYFAVLCYPFTYTNGNWILQHGIA